MSGHVLRRTVLWGLGIGCAAAGVGFGLKLHEFASDALASEGIGFAGPHLLTYALVAGGFAMLLAAAFMRGHLADVEQPKHDLLERERRHDRADYGPAAR